MKNNRKAKIKMNNTKAFKQSQKMKNKEQGFVLVTVMLLTMMAGTVVLTSLQDNTVQERLSGNFQNNINTRIMSEKGIYDAYNAMNATLQLTGTDSVNNASEVVKEAFNNSNTMNDNFSISATDADGNVTTYEVNITVDGDEISVASVGKDNEGVDQLRAIYKLVGGAGSAPFDFGTGVTGCESVSITGSGLIDSYDSALGDYGTTVGNVTNIDSNANVSTIYRDSGDITANNVGTVFDGNINATGNVTLSGTNHVKGNINANGTIYLSGIPVDGNVVSRKSITILDARAIIGGYLLAQEDIDLTAINIAQGVQTHSNFKQVAGAISGNVQVVGSVDLDDYSGSTSIMVAQALLYGGANLKNITRYDNDLVGTTTAGQIKTQIGEVPEVPFEDRSEPELSTVTCDPHDIATEVDNVDPGVGVVLPALVLTTDGNEYVMSRLEADFTKRNGASSGPLEKTTAVSATFLSDTLQMLMYESVSISGDVIIAANQDVTMYVRGDFTMGGVGTLTIPDGSSLTLIIEGKITIDGSGKIITPVDGLTDESKPVFAIYSSYKSDGGDQAWNTDWGVELLGGGSTAANGDDFHAVIYAPLADISVASAASFKGSVYGNSVTVSGAGGIHYDEALGRVSSGSGTGTSGTDGFKLVFQGWQFPDVVDDTTETADTGS